MGLQQRYILHYIPLIFYFFCYKCFKKVIVKFVLSCVFNFTIQASVRLIVSIQVPLHLLCKYIFLLLFVSHPMKMLVFLFFLKHLIVYLILHNWICRKHLIVLSLLEVHPLQNGEPLEHLWDTQNLLS